jgi:anaerobic ribonucleoside-triphosphate reductase activating protein
MTSIQIAQIRTATRAEGPGKRLALWTQGCSLKCHGCFNPHLWISDESKERDVSVVISEIEMQLATEPDVEGLSFLGGEPFNQAGALAEIGHYFRGLGYSLTTFTGFTYEALLSQSRQNHSFLKLLSETDLLIDGPFIEKRIDRARPWLGSTNQKYRFLTNRYSMKDIDSSTDSVEITVDESGGVLINGWAPIEQVKSLTVALMVE